MLVKYQEQTYIASHSLTPLALGLFSLLQACAKTMADKLRLAQIVHNMSPSSKGTMYACALEAGG